MKINIIHNPFNKNLVGNLKIHDTAKSYMENITQLNLVSKKIRLEKYAYFKHIGPYSTLPEAYANVLSKLKTINQKVVSPCVEIYGHWTDDEAKLETEIIYALE